jgi:hypothetical protein
MSVMTVHFFINHRSPIISYYIRKNKKVNHKICKKIVKTKPHENVSHYRCRIYNYKSTNL